MPLGASGRERSLLLSAGEVVLDPDYCSPHAKVRAVVLGGAEILTVSEERQARKQGSKQTLPKLINTIILYCYYYFYSRFFWGEEEYLEAKDVRCIQNKAQRQEVSDTVL